MNVPGFFSLVWRIAEPMLSPSTRKKIRLCHSKAVRAEALLRARYPGSQSRLLVLQIAIVAALCCPAAWHVPQTGLKIGFVLCIDRMQPCLDARQVHLELLPASCLSVARTRDKPG